MTDKENEMTKQELLGRIEVDPKIMVGKPVIRGTRIPVELILRMLSEGASSTVILAEYPHLSTEDIRAALAYAAETLAEEEVLPLERAVG